VESRQRGDRNRLTHDSNRFAVLPPNCRFPFFTETIKLPNLSRSTNRNINDPNISTFDITSSKRRIIRGFSLNRRSISIDRRFFSRCKSWRPIQSNRLPSGIFPPNTISSKALISRIATAAHSHLHLHLHFQRGECWEWNTHGNTAEQTAAIWGMRRTPIAKIQVYICWLAHILLY